MNKSFCCSPSWSALVLSKTSVGQSHSNRFIVISYCYFTLHFPCYVWCGTSFHMLICHLCFFGDMSLKVVRLLFNRLLVFLFLSFKFCIFRITLALYQLSFAIIFSQYVTCLLFSDIFFLRKEVLNFDKPILPIMLGAILIFKKSHHIQGHLCLLCYFLGVFKFCTLHFGLWSILR